MPAGHGRIAAVNRPCRRICLPLLLAMATVVAGCNPPGSAGLTGKTIRYQVEYYSSALDSQSHSALTIVSSTNEGEEQQRNVSLPWTKAIGPANRGLTASVKAQFDGFGTISCRIVADGEVVVTQTSAQQPYPTVECSA